MGRYRPALFLGLAIVIALITSVMVFSWLREQAQQKAQTGTTVQTTMVAVANADFSWGTKLQREMVQLTAYPTGSLPKGYFTNVDALQGRILLVPIKRNELMLESKLAPVTVATGGVSAVLDPTKRAMSVKVDEVIGVSGFIQSGDRVDVMVTIQPSQGGDNIVSKVVLQNIRVLAAGTQMERSGKDQEAKPVQVITLEVDPLEAEKLALASNQGKLRLALRNPINAEPVLTQGVTVSSLLRSFQTAQPPKPTPKPKVKPEIVTHREPVPQPEPVRKTESVPQPEPIPKVEPVPQPGSRVELIKGIKVEELKFNEAK